jgi:hypothetical protein
MSSIHRAFGTPRRQRDESTNGLATGIPPLGHPSAAIPPLAHGRKTA